MMEDPDELSPVSSPVDTEDISEELLEVMEVFEAKEVNASEKALSFLSSIDPSEMQRCVFPDSLVNMTEEGESLGRFSVTVKFAERNHQACMVLHMESEAARDDSPCGVTVTTYLTTSLEVLEEEYNESILLDGCNMDTRLSMVQCDEDMVIEKATTVGEEVTRESHTYPMFCLKGLITEGSQLVLMRVLAMRGQVPKKLTCICLDDELNIINTTFSGLGKKQIDPDTDNALTYFGVERIIQSLDDSPKTWQCFFKPDGHLVRRAEVGSAIVTRLPLSLSQEQTGVEIIPLIWDEDLEMYSRFLDKKRDLIYDHAKYLRQRPEIRALISDFLQFLLLRKPDDVFHFAREYFLPFASRCFSEDDEQL